MSKTSRKTGFTLVELLVVIAIIGILVGLLVPVIGAASRRVSEFAINNDVNELERALELFNSEFEFYPPDMSEINSAQEFLPFLNKISRNHREGNGGPGTNLETWWNAIGVNLDNESAMVFWLSGISADASFPLTNGGAPLPAHNVGTAVERRVFFDFPQNQLQVNSAGTVARFVQRRGASRQPYVYFSASSYEGSGPISSHQSTLDGSVVMPYFSTNPNVAAAIEESEGKFQVIAAGVDGKFGSTGDLANRSTEDNDNLCSFSDGRLEKVLN